MTSAVRSDYSLSDHASAVLVGRSLAASGISSHTKHPFDSLMVDRGLQSILLRTSMLSCLSVHERILDSSAGVSSPQVDDILLIIICINIDINVGLLGDFFSNTGRAFFKFRQWMLYSLNLSVAS